MKSRVLATELHKERLNFQISELDAAVRSLVSFEDVNNLIIFQTDFIILKDVTELKQVAEFRKLSDEFESIPIILWIGILKTEAANELIKVNKVFPLM